MNDTSADVEARAASFHDALTPDERWRICSAMFETARAIIVSSLPAGLSAADRAVAVARRFYEGEISEAAFQAIIAAKDR